MQRYRAFSSDRFLGSQCTSGQLSFAVGSFLPVAVVARVIFQASEPPFEDHFSTP